MGSSHGDSGRLGAEPGTARTTQAKKKKSRMSLFCPYRYVLQFDIQQVFPAIDHAILREIVSRKISDPHVLGLIDEILASGDGVLSEVYELAYFSGDDLFAATRARGLPIGNLTSQFWANVYLNPFDHFVKRELQCPAYLRYVDDFLLFGDDKCLLWSWKKAIVERLARLRLTVHPGAQLRLASEGIPFLGFIVFPDRRRLKRRKGIQFQRRLRALASSYARGAVTLDRVAASVRGWVNHVRYGNTLGLRRLCWGHCPSEVVQADNLQTGLPQVIVAINRR
jgi:hypothetical protein